jgi:hypothetical protein
MFWSDPNSCKGDFKPLHFHNDFRAYTALKDSSTQNQPGLCCYRFSHSGKFIATCSDDKLVIIYELLPGRGKAVFGEQAHNLEEWKVRHSLRGHRCPPSIAILGELHHTHCMHPELQLRILQGGPGFKIQKNSYMLNVQQQCH